MLRLSAVLSCYSVFSLAPLILMLSAVAGTASVYSSATSLVLILLWVYYASLILLLSAEFTEVHARSRGRMSRPSTMAVRVQRTVEAIKDGEEPMSASVLRSRRHLRSCSTRNPLAMSTSTTAMFPSEQIYRLLMVRYMFISGVTDTPCNNIDATITVRVTEPTLIAAAGSNPCVMAKPR